MARKTKAQLLIEANLIKNATSPSENTASRVGTMLIDIVDSMVNNDDDLIEWDMSTNLFPSGSLEGQRYYGINGPTNTLFDRAGNAIPDGVILTSLTDVASTTSALDWALEYTITV